MPSSGTYIDEDSDNNDDRFYTNIGLFDVSTCSCYLSQNLLKTVECYKLFLFNSKSSVGNVSTNNDVS